MNKEFKILSILSTLTLITYILFPNIKDDEVKQEEIIEVSDVDLSNPSFTASSSESCIPSS